MKIGIIGNANYQNISKIKQDIIELKSKYGDDLIIFSGGENNIAEEMVKDFSQFNSIFFFEFTPKYANKNTLSFLPTWYYTKNKQSKPSTRWFIDRYNKMFDTCDAIRIYGHSEHNKTYVSYCNNRNIPVLIIE